MTEKGENMRLNDSMKLWTIRSVPLERFSIAFTANVRLKFPVDQKLVKLIWFQLIFYLLVTAMEQVLKTEK